MNKLLIILFLISSITLIGQTPNRVVKIGMKSFVCGFRNDMEPTAQRAFRIATAIFNSPEFQKEISDMSFSCESYCKGCKSISLNNQNRISGEEVLNKLFSERSVEMTLELKKSGSALGETRAGAYYTTAWHDNIQADMPEFNFDFAYALAINICHEYMHQVGFCHLYCTGWTCAKKNRLNEPNGNPDPKFIEEDVTYKVGWAAYHILINWHKDNRVIE
jgi:hypothetical protein